MIVGYFDNNARVFCVTCWSAHAERGARPSKVLDSEDALDPESKFWIVDECADCGAKVKYQELTALN